MISSSCHVRAEGGGVRGRGREADDGRCVDGDADDADGSLVWLLKEVRGATVLPDDETKAVGCAKAAMSVTVRGRGT